MTKNGLFDCQPLKAVSTVLRTMHVCIGSSHFDVMMSFLELAEVRVDRGYRTMQALVNEQRTMDVCI